MILLLLHGSFDLYHRYIGLVEEKCDKNSNKSNISEAYRWIKGGGRLRLYT